MLIALISIIFLQRMLEQLIEDKSFSLFPQVISTERPDRVASFLMDGKAALVCEGTPFALAMPITFFDLFIHLKIQISAGNMEPF